MKKWLLLIFVFIGCMALFVCSNNNVVSDDGDGGDPPPTDTVFNITATADTDHSSSQIIIASNGGELTLTNAVGVIFTLTIPPYSLPNDTLVTLTAIDSFALTGPVTFGCVDSSNSSGFCFEGILCEPVGLYFDSGATLSVQFPQSDPFPFDSSIGLLYFETSETKLFPCQIEIDSATYQIICSINHFSGYVTTSVPYLSEDDLCAMLYTSYNDLKVAAGNTMAIDRLISYLRLIMDLKSSNHYTNSFDPLAPTAQLQIECSSFNGTIESDLPPILTSFWNNLKGVWNENGIDYIPQMISDYEDSFEALHYLANTNSYNAFEQIQREMKILISDRIKTWAETGHALCATTNEVDCEQGSIILTAVLNYGDQHYVITASNSIDIDFLTQVQNWLNDCCARDFNINLTVPGGTTIYRLALDPNDVYGDPYAYVCSVNVSVTGPSGTPLEGIPIQLWREGATSKISSNSSNAEGNAAFIISPSSIAWNCQEYETWTFYAKAYDANTENWTDPSNSVEVMFLNSTVTTTINYQFHYEWVGGDYSSTADATVTGSGSAPIRPLGNCTSACSGTLIRTYSYSNCTPDGCNSGTSLADEGVYACRAVGDIDEILLDNGKTVEFLIGLRVSLGSAVFAGLQYETSSGTTETLQYGLEMSVWPEDGFYFSDENGVDGDTTWTWDSSDDPNMVGLKTVTYTVQVSLDNK